MRDRVAIRTIFAGLSWPAVWRSIVRRATFPIRQVSAHRRAFPDFLVIGAMRSGTTSFYRALLNHPQVRPAVKKEIHYFDRFYSRGTEWYRSHFPLVPRNGAPRVWKTGEATPAYLFHPDASNRAWQTVPTAQCIAILRNPTDRAISQYRYERMRGAEHRSPERAFDEEFRSVAAERHTAHSYVARGRYVEQLQRWLEVFGSNRVLVLRSEDVFSSRFEPQWRRIEAFLGLAAAAVPALERANASSLHEIPPRVRAALRTYYAPQNAKLERLIGRPMGWDST